ncbi:hypothetical protein V6N13_055463 [Hibiscus sabdariffa]|uniref:Uncharacterized protein n=2 Tax=Hibiscus sabdariffa TaxID=183260 RepID=A0ABR2NTK4_9ROSI
MGNCLTSTKVVAQIDQDEYEYEEPRHGSRLQEPTKETAKVTDKEGAAEVADAALKKIKNKNKNKKVVRFKLDEESNAESGRTQGESNNVVVRMRFVVSQKELEQILSSGKDLSKCSSMEELVRIMRSRAGNCVSSDQGFHGAWRPALESIAEEH